MAIALFLGGLSFLLAVVWGAPLIRFLKARRIGKQIRLEGPQIHQVKAGTPTMGGLMILIPVVLITAALNIADLVGLNRIGQQILVPMGTMVLFGVLGAIDDWINVRGKRARGEGISGRAKFMWQVVFALGIALFLHFGRTQLRSVAVPGV